MNHSNHHVGSVGDKDINEKFSWNVGIMGPPAMPLQSPNPLNGNQSTTLRDSYIQHEMKLRLIWVVEKICRSFPNVQNQS